MEVASVVDRAFALREQRLKAKKPVAAQETAAQETAAPLLPQQPKSLQGTAPSRDEALADLRLEEEEKDDAPCPAGDPPPGAAHGGRAEPPCDFPAAEGSLSATDASARLRALYKQSRTVMQKAYGSHKPESSNFPSTSEEVSVEATQMFKLVEDWMGALGLEDDV